MTRGIPEEAWQELHPSKEDADIPIHKEVMNPPDENGDVWGGIEWPCGCVTARWVIRAGSNVADVFQDDVICPRCYNEGAGIID